MEEEYEDVNRNRCYLAPKENPLAILPHVGLDGVPRKNRLGKAGLCGRRRRRDRGGEGFDTCIGLKCWINRKAFIVDSCASIQDIPAAIIACFLEASQCMTI